MTLLSVITVVKDDAAGLGRTVASLRGQDLSDVELIVVDSSADRGSTEAILVGVSPVTYQWSPPRGVYPAMNEGLKLAGGDYCYFLNAGDVLVARDVVRRIKAALRVKPVWAYGWVRFRDADGSTMPEPAWSYEQEREHWFARGRFPAHQGVVARTEALRAQNGFDTTYRVAADYAAILGLSEVGPPARLGFTIAEFEVGGLSTQQWRVAQEEFHRARREILQPRGLDATRELAYTWRGKLATLAYRSLWAPGRPAHRVVRRLRSR